MQSNIYSSTRFFFYILKILGLAPYQIDKKSFKLQMSFVNYFIFLVQIIVWSVYYYFLAVNYESIEMMNYAKSTIMDGLLKHLYIFQYFLMVISMIYNFFKRKHVETFLKLIQKFDATVDKFGWGFEVVHSKFFVLIVCLTASIFMLLFNCFGYFYSNVYDDKQDRKIEILFDVIAYLFLTEYFLVVSLQFICSCQCVNARFERLLKNIK